MEFSKIEIRNYGKRNFDDLEAKHLGGYVYALKDPRDNKIFYVGQGHGNRLFNHFVDAENFLKGKIKPTSKILRIIDVWNAEEDVIWLILSYNLHAEVLTMAETIAIDSISQSQNGQVLNDQGGIDSKVMFEEDLFSIRAKPIDPDIPIGKVFMFSVGKTFGPKDIYEATRKAWKVKSELRNLTNAYAVGIVNGISRGSYKIARWQESEGDRYEFVKDENNNLDCDHLMEKNWLKIINFSKGYWQRGNFFIVEFNGKGQFRIIRGSSIKDWQPLKE